MNNNILLVPIAFFAFLAIVILVPIGLRHRARMAALNALSEAMEKGRAADAALIERLLIPAQPAVGKWFALVNLMLGFGALCIGIALALAVHLLGYRLGLDATSSAGMMVGALVNGCIGVGLTTLGVVSMRLFSGRRRPAPQWDYASVLALVSLFLGTSGLSIATGLALASQLYVGPAGDDSVAAGLLMGALVNGCSGIGFTVLGVLILRAFVTVRKP